MYPDTYITHTGWINDELNKKENRTTYPKSMSVGIVTITSLQNFPFNRETNLKVLKSRPKAQHRGRAVTQHSQDPRSPSSAQQVGGARRKRWGTGLFL